MSARDTVIRVLQWAVLAEGGPPPSGSAGNPMTLAQPDETLKARFGELIRTASARHRLDTPVLGDPKPPGIHGLLLALALANLRQPQLVLHLLAGVPEAHTPTEMMARHALAAPALPYIPRKGSDEAPDLAEEFLSLSPLTALFHMPIPGAEHQIYDLTRTWLQHPQGRRMLCDQLAQPLDDPRVLAWRHQLLERLRTGGREDFVLDVFQHKMIYFTPETLDEINAAEAVIGNPLSPEPELRRALAIARFWGPMHAICRADPDAPRARTYLGYRYLRGIELHQLARRFQGGAS
ncbi:MAG: hypothetical protein QNK37_14710 [Acidobacteriota bacterium]|nr:hypothetical protein [Acidobacteriota bacterium]